MTTTTARRAPAKGLTFTPGNHTYRLDGKPVPGTVRVEFEAEVQNARIIGSRVQLTGMGASDAHLWVPADAKITEVQPPKPEPTLEERLANVLTVWTNARAAADSLAKQIIAIVREEQE